jgi:hypothetical protein
MNDCSNANIRDQLPDLLHDRLSVSVRAAVMAHVDGCMDCRDELELLRGVRGALVAQTPRVDIAYVVGALPKAPTRPAVVASAHAPHRDGPTGDRRNRDDSHRRWKLGGTPGTAHRSGCDTFGSDCRGDPRNTAQASMWHGRMRER